MRAIDLPNANYAFDVLLSQYTGLHYVNFEEDNVVSYIISERIQDTEALLKQKRHFAVMWNQFVSFAVHPDDKEEMLRYCRFDFLRELLAEENVATHVFRRAYSEGYLYTMMKIVVVERDAENNPESIVLMFEEINDEISATFHMEQSVRNSLIQKNITEGLAMLVESRDLNTGAHIQRTGELYSMLVDKLSKDHVFPELEDETYCADIKYGSVLHDIGKIFVSDVILNKPGRLTPEEFEIVKTHTTFGANIVDEIFAKNIDNDTSRAIRDIVLSHHERWDGRGYPNGLAGEDIPLAARIMAVTDVFDALISKRPYKDGMSVDEALSIIKLEAGTHFDARIVKAFEGIKTKVKRYLGTVEYNSGVLFDAFSEQVQNSSRRVAVVNKLVDEFESIYLVNLDENKVYATKASENQVLDESGSTYSEMAASVIDLVADNDRSMFASLGDVHFLRGYLHDEDRREFIFHMKNDELRRCIIQVSSRKDGAPYEVIFSFMKVDDERSRNIELTEELERNYGMIEGLASEYLAVYYIDLDDDKLIPYSNNESVERIMVGEYKDDTAYARSMERYADTCVKSEYSEMVRIAARPETIRRELAHQKSFSRIYLNDQDQYREMKFVKVGSQYDEPKLIALGFTDIDDAYRQALESESIKALTRELTEDYEAIFQVDMEKDTVTTVKITPDFGERNHGLKDVMTYDEYIESLSSNLYPEDRDDFIKASSEDAITADFENSNVTYHNYRIMKNGIVEYRQLKTINTRDWAHSRQFLVGIYNVDNLIKLEQKQKDDIVQSVNYAFVDDLTGIYNFRGFRKNAEGVFNENRVSGVASFIGYLDVDKLREVNEKFGHEEGDYNLKQGAQIIKDLVGDKGLIGRVGGDEFALIVSVDEPKGFGKRAIHKAKKALEDYNRTSCLPYKLSATFGGYLVEPDNEVSFQEALSRAAADSYSRKKRDTEK